MVGAEPEAREVNAREAMFSPSLCPSQETFAIAAYMYFLLGADCLKVTYAPVAG